MFFEQEYIIFEILDVLYLDQPCSKICNTNRNFDAISFRFSADTTICAGEQEFELSDNDICFIPSNLTYTRKSKKDQLISIHFKSFNCHLEKMECFTPEMPEKYETLFKKILACWDKKGVSYKSECAALFYKILSLIYNENQSVCKNKKIEASVLYLEKIASAESSLWRPPPHSLL